MSGHLRYARRFEWSCRALKVEFLYICICKRNLIEILFSSTALWLQ